MIHQHFVSQQPLTDQQFADMLMAASKPVLANISELNQLDTETGDGDHGTSMFRVMQSLRDTLAQHEGMPRKQLADAVGWNIMSQDGGSAGMLMGAFFMGIGDGLEQEQGCLQELSHALQVATQNLLSSSGAKVGDKTMVDALVPAVETLAHQAAGHALPAMAFLEAAQAAQAGAESTKDMFPVRGRAKNIGERALGHQDPGATSMAMIFAGFADYWAGQQLH